MLETRVFLSILLGLVCTLELPSSAWSQTDTATDSSVRVATEAAQSNWPRFLGDTYDGVSQTDPSQIDWSVDPKLAWVLPVGAGYGVGSVSQGRFFQADAGPPNGLQIPERIRCLDLATGIEIWSQSTPIIYQDMLGYEDGPRSSPTIAGDQVFTFGVTGILSCRSVLDGKLIWQVDTNQTYGVVQNFFGVGSAPLILDDRVIVMVGGSPPEDQNLPPMRLDRVAPNGSAVVAFDRQTGKELWKCGDDLASYSSPRPIQLNGETLVLVFARAGLMGIDPAVGSVRWRFDHRAEILESVNAMVPVVDGNHVLISECYEVGSVLLEVSGKSQPKVVWQDPHRDRRTQAMRSHWATPVLAEGFLYGCSGRNAPDSDFRCIDFKSGQVQWTDPRQIRSSVTRLGHHLLVLEEQGSLQVIKANPKELDVVTTWQLDKSSGERPALEFPCWSAPVVVGNRLIVRGNDLVLCLELATR
jgi:outer membrane protein assembly factor BamB